MSAITVSQICKTFDFKVHHGLRGFFRPEKKSVQAVRDISFEVARGEALAFIGPNGAGKSTTIKMLTGILQPTSGDIRVLGKRPLHERRELAMHIGTVFGQRSQLVFNLPLTESFALSASMYRIAPHTARERAAQLIEQFGLEEFVSQPVRKLSLGQRMRAEVANALIHQPDIIFLDEPTIGLDIVAKRSLREVIRHVNREQGTTVFLTSHDVGDIEEVCTRTMIVNHGSIVLDAETASLKRDYIHSKKVSVVPSGPLPKRCVIDGLAASLADGRLVFAVDTTKHRLNQFIQHVLAELDIADITIEDPLLEDIIHELYTSEKA